MMSIDRIISEIRQINPSADRTWLNTFSREQLLGYLDHLQITLEPRGSSLSWKRPGDTPAVVTRKRRAA